MSEFDVIVIGGGPAGVSTALTCAKKGKKVVILDRKKKDQIGNKTCGDALDALSPNILNAEIGIDLPKDDEISSIVKTITIATRNKSVSIDGPGWTVDRHIYGQRLLNDCEKEGVKVIGNAIIRDVIVENNFVVGVKYRQKGEFIEIRGKVVADCSGILGAVRSRLPDELINGFHKKIPDHHIAATFREIVNMKEKHQYSEEIVLAYEEDIPPPGYIWFFSKGDKELNIGTGWLKSENKHPQGMKRIYKDALENYYTPDQYDVTVASGGQIPIRPPYDCQTFNGGLLVGDAGCFVDPTTAEGHGPALVTGFYAGRAICEAIDNKNVSREGLWRYNVDSIRKYGKRNISSYEFLHLLRKLGGNGMDFVLRRELITEKEILGMVDGSDVHISLKSIIKKVIKSFPKYGILMDLKKAVSRIDILSKIYEEYPENPKDLKEWSKKRDEILGEVL